MYTLFDDRARDLLSTLTQEEVIPYSNTFIYLVVFPWLLIRVVRVTIYSIPSTGTNDPVIVLQSYYLVVIS